MNIHIESIAKTAQFMVLVAVNVIIVITTKLTRFRNISKNYTLSGKRCHFILDYNSAISWSTFIIFVPLETKMNTPQSCVIYLLKGLMTS